MLHTRIYSLIACQLEVGTPIITFAVEVRCQIGDQFWISQPKLNRSMDFFVKPKESALV